MNASDVVALLLAHKWLGATALVIGFLVRLLKSDTPLPTLPARFRPWLALGLGALSAMVDSRVNGTDWRTALVAGLGAGLVAIMGHDTVVESLRNGREFFQKKEDGGGSKPPPPSGRSLRPALPGDTDDALRTALEKERESTKSKRLRSRLIFADRFAWVVAIALPFVTIGILTDCKNPNTQNLVVTGLLDLEQTACIILQGELGQNEPAVVATLCKIDPKLIEQVIKLLSAQRSARLQKIAIDRAPKDLAASLGRDAGLEAGK